MGKSDAWGGAQWVLICWWIAVIFIPLVVRANGLNTKPWVEFRDRYVGQLINIVIMASLLAWGGFWE